MGLLIGTNFCHERQKTTYPFAVQLPIGTNFGDKARKRYTYIHHGIAHRYNFFAIMAENGIPIYAMGLIAHRVKRAICFNDRKRYTYIYTAWD